MITSTIMVHLICVGNENYILQTSFYLSPQFYKMGIKGLQSCLPAEITVKLKPRQADSKVHDIVFQLGSSLSENIASVANICRTF